MPETHEIVIGVALLALILFALNDKDAITDKMLEHSPDDDDDDEARRRKVKREELDERLAKVKVEQVDWAGRAERFLDEANGGDDPPPTRIQYVAEHVETVGRRNSNPRRDD